MSDPNSEDPRGEAKTYPLSSAQERLWFLHQLSPDEPVYTIFDGFRLSGALDVAALQEALDAVVQRHEVLRTTFQRGPKEPVQVVAARGRVPIQVHALDHVPPSEREARALALANQAFRQPFDIERGPVLRAGLATWSGTEHVLFLTMHHATAEVVSFSLLNRELEELYNARQQRRAPRLPELPLQFGEVALRERERLRSGQLAKHLDYWKRRFAGTLPILHLPTDRPRPAVLSSRGGWRSRMLAPALAPALRGLAAQEGVSLFMLLMAAYQTFLHRITGQEDVTVGTPFSIRKRDTQSLIGFLQSMLAVRTDLAGDPTFRDVIARVRDVCLEGFLYGEVPFEKLIEELHPERDLSHAVLCQTFLSVVHGDTLTLRLDGLTPGRFLGPDQVHNDGAKVDLHLFVEDRGTELMAGCEYATDILEGATIDRWLEHFETMLHGLVADADRPISRLPLLSEAERARLLRSAGDEVRYPAGETLHEVFAGHVRRTPQAPAVTGSGGTLTYAELDARANRLAHRLVALGVGPDARVGVCMPRTESLLVAILGVLKAGGAYVPFDPIYPRERIELMARDAEVKAVVTEGELREHVAGCGAPVVALDDAAVLAAESTRAPATSVKSDHLAYVIYTSGSTGVPKGTLITHENVRRLFEAPRRAYGFSAQDTWSLFHSYNFDVSVWEMWGALLHGGRSVVLPQDVVRVPEEIYAWLQRERVTVFCQTPSAFRQLIAADQRLQADLDVRLVFVAGEALEFQSLRPWLQRHGDDRASVINAYGPTEATVYTTYRHVRARDVERGAGSIIGRPMGDVEVYLLDKHLQPVPIGVAGELWIGGAGVAKGYLHRPELTAERFVRDPFRADPQALLYRSGDLARYDASLDIEYLGRIDHQVKIRGFRVELGEIEAKLAAQPGVKECVAVAREYAPGDLRVVAYVVPREGTAPDPAQWRGVLKQKLPEYMIPAAFVLLPALPLNRNGKVDRGALPKPPAERADVGEFVLPRSERERRVAAVFAELLQVERVGAEDSFFDLGGHSLLLVQVHGHLLRDFPDSGLTMVDLFRYPTVAALAKRLSSSEAALQPPSDRGAARRAGLDRRAQQRARRDAGRTASEGEAAG